PPAMNGVSAMVKASFATRLHARYPRRTASMSIAQIRHSRTGTNRATCPHPRTSSLRFTGIDLSAHAKPMTAVRLPCDDALVHMALDSEQCSKPTGRAVLVATILASSMTFIDGSVVNVALPVLRAKLGATGGARQAIVDAYML